MTSEPSAVGTALAAFFFLVFVIGFFSFRTPEERRFLLPLAVAAFTIKAILVPIYYVVLVGQGLEGFAFSDSIAYHYDGIEFARELARGIDYRSHAWGTTDPGYPLLTGLVYWITGPNTLILRLLNCALTTFSLLYVYRIARMLFDEEVVARIACYLTALLPYATVIAINHRKDPLVQLLVTFLVYQSLRVIRYEKNWPRAVIWVAIGVFAISFFRSGFVLPFLGTFVVCYLLAQRSVLQTFAIAIPVIAILIVFQIVISPESTISIGASADRVLGKFEHSAALSQVGGLARLARMTSPLEIYKLPLAVTLATIVPFPPHFVGSLPSILLSWMNLFNLALLPHVLRGGWSVLRRPDYKKCLLLVLVPVMILLVLGAVHVGVARYRETIAPIMWILAAVGIRQHPNLPFNAVVYSLLLLMGGVSYFARLM